MGVIGYFFLVLIVGLVVWAIREYTPIPTAFKNLILIAGLIVLVIVLLQLLGVLGGADIPFPRVRR